MQGLSRQKQCAFEFLAFPIILNEFEDSGSHPAHKSCHHDNGVTERRKVNANLGALRPGSGNRAYDCKTIAENTDESVGDHEFVEARGTMRIDCLL